MKRLISRLLLLLLLPGGSLWAQSGSLPANAVYWPGKIVVKLAPGYEPPGSRNLTTLSGWAPLMAELQVDQISQAFPLIPKPDPSKRSGGAPQVDLSGIYYLDYRASMPIEAAIQRLQRLPSVAYAEPWYLHEAFYQPNDPKADTSFSQGGQWYLNQIMAREAWDLQRGDTNVVVAIVDAGNNSHHPDMKGNLAYNWNDPIDGIDNDEDGYLDNWAGWDFGGATLGAVPDNDPNVFDAHGHWVAGVTGATTDNGIGIASVGFNCRYLPIKAAPDDSARIFFGYQGLLYAVEQGAQIVNCSWGSRFPSQFGQDVVRYATLTKGAAIIAAAGNSNQDEAFYPAAFEEVISVVNTTRGDTIYINKDPFTGPTGSSTYHRTADISAPGDRISSVEGDQGYSSFFTGTSFAAPVAAGVTAITLSHFPNLTGFQAAQRVRVTTDNHYAANGPDQQDKLGTGRVNMWRALNDQQRPSIRRTDYTLVDADGDGQFQPGDTLWLSLDLINYLHRADSLKIGLSLTQIQALFVELIQANHEIGNIDMWETKSTGPVFGLYLKPNLPLDFQLLLRFTYEDMPTAYTDFDFLDLRVNRTWLDLRENQIHTTISSRGRFGFHDYGTLQEGLGLHYASQGNVLFEGALLLGTNSNQVSDAVRNNMGGAEEDFQLTAPIEIVHDPQRSDFEAILRYHDGAASQPLGIGIRQHVFANRDPEEDDYLIFQYHLQNQQNNPLNNLYAGLFADWDIYAGQVNRNGATYLDSIQLAYAYDFTGSKAQHYGMSLLTGGPFRSFALTIPGLFNFSTASKFTAISNSPSPGTASAGLNTSGADIAQFVASGPHNLPAQGTDSVAFAIVAGNSLSELIENRAAAQRHYFCHIEAQGPLEPFSISHSVAEPGFPVLFSDQNAQASSWQWDFGDGNTSPLVSPLHSYAMPGVYTVRLTVSDGYCEATSTQIITITNSVNLEPGLEATAMHLYPQPNEGRFTLQLEGAWTGAFELRILHPTGQLLWQEAAHKSSSHWEQVLQVPEWPEGVYLLEVRADDYRGIQKIWIR